MEARVRIWRFEASFALSKWAFEYGRPRWGDTFGYYVWAGPFSFAILPKGFPRLDSWCDD